MHGCLLQVSKQTNRGRKKKKKRVNEEFYANYLNVFTLPFDFYVTLSSM